ncbi:MAG TPA: tripartite tricarboxylate transporter substrate-binding protein [Ramlibacter sp.]|nr:tripartite tricarboxylate transporter substrate-binding protein [Ramlibacter sp.]
MTKPLLTLVSAAILALGSTQVAAQTDAYPRKPVTIVVPFAAGGPTDVVTRALAAAMTTSLGQPVVVENKLGAGGTVAAGAVARSTPDGYTLLTHHNGMATAPALYRKLAYTPLNDFEFVSQVIDVPMTLIGRKDLPPKDLRELIPYLKVNAAKINVAHAGLGAVSHLCSLLFRQAIGVELQTVPYQGTGPAMNALLGGQVDLLCDQTTSTTAHIKAGTVKLYGVTSLQRVSSLPQAPTLNEQGLKGFQMVVWHGIYAPKGTPQPVLQKLNAAVRSALKDPAFQQRMKELGAEIVPEAKQTPEGLRTWLKSETDRMGPVIRAAGAYAD